MTSDIEPYDSTGPERQLSSILIEKIDACISKFKNHIVTGSELQNSVNDVYAQAEAEGISKDDIKDIIFNKLLTVGYSKSTIYRYLPDKLKRSGGYSKLANSHVRIQKTPAQQAIELKQQFSSSSETQNQQQPGLSYEERKAAMEREYNIPSNTQVENEVYGLEGSQQPEQPQPQQQDSYLEIKQLKEENERLRQQIKILSEDNAIRKAMALNDQEEITRLRLLLKKAGIPWKQETEAGAAA